MKERKRKKNEKTTMSQLLAAPGSFLFTRFLIIFLFLLGVMLFSSYTIFQVEKSLEIDFLNHQEEDRIQLFDAEIKEKVELVRASMSILSSNGTLQEYLRVKDPIIKQRISQEILTKAKERKYYDQIRVLDTNGNELIRINKVEDDFVIVKDHLLQNKADRYYFQEAARMQPGEFYVSPLDLNVEYGQVEIPHEPMIRFASPLFVSGELRGVLVLNYLAKDLFDGLDEMYLNARGTLMIADTDGYLLKGDNPDTLFSFMFPEKKQYTIQDLYPQVWEALHANNKGQIVNQSGYYTYHTIAPYAGLEEFIGSYHSSDDRVANGLYHWHLISFVSHEDASPAAEGLIRSMVFSDILLAFILLILSWVLAVAIEKRAYSEKKLKTLTELFKMINRILRHDVRSKLTVIRYGIEMTKGYKKKAGLVEAYKAVEKSLELIAQMKELEALAEQDRSELEPILINDVLDDVIKQYNLPIKVTGEAVVKVDQAFKSVLDNIIRNAVMHSESEKMDVKISPDQSKVTIKFIDYGVGIPDDLHKEIFKEGAKFGPTGNTGLGLFIVEQTIKRYGGEVRVEDTKPHGATFIIDLPRA